MKKVRKKKIGIKTTTDKEFYCLKGKKLIKKHRIIVTDNETKNQLQSFGYVKGKIKGIACHDDLSYPTVSHIARMLEETNFIDWLSDYLYMQVDSITRFKLNSLIEKWALDNHFISVMESEKELNHAMSLVRYDYTECCNNNYYYRFNYYFSFIFK